MDYGQILKNSIAVTKKNKWLWVYGALVGGMGIQGGGGGGGGQNTENTKDFNLDNIPGEVEKVLGTYTSQVIDWFNSVSATTWITLGIGILLALVIGISFSLILNAWAKASLITGIQMALKGELVNLENTSTKGKEKIRSLIKLWFLSFGIFLAFLLALGILSGLVALGFLISQTTGVVAFIIVGLPGIFVALAGLILLGMTGIYSERFIILNSKDAFASWKMGFGLAKKNFGATALMGIITGITGGLFSFLGTIGALIVLAIPALVMIVPSIIGKHMPSVPVFVLLGLLLTLFFAAASAIQAMVNVFKFTNWNQIFNQFLDQGSDLELQTNKNL